MAQRNLVPGAQNINHENVGHPQSASDPKVMQLLENLISTFGELEKTILYRTFESLENPDNEKSPDLFKCHKLFQKNLLFFRHEFPNQMPLFGNIGFVAQRIGRIESFKDMFNRPKLPSFLQVNQETHTRVYLLVKHYHSGDIITLRPQPEEIEKKGMLYIGYFFTFVTVKNSNNNNESSLEYQDGFVQENGMYKMEPIVWMNGNKKCSLYVLSDVGNRNPITFSIAVNQAYSHPKTLFSWFCVQHVSFQPSCRIIINHNNKKCQVPPHQFCNPRYICPVCGQSYKMSDVSIIDMPTTQIPQATIPQQPYQAYNQVKQQQQPSYYPPQNYKQQIQKIPNQVPPLSQIPNQQGQQINNGPSPPQIQSHMQGMQQKPVVPTMRPGVSHPMPIPQQMPQAQPQQTTAIPTPLPQQRPPIPQQMPQQYHYMAQTNQQIPQHPIPQQIPVMQQQSMMTPQQNMRSPYPYAMSNYMSPQQMRSPAMSSAISPTTPQQMQTSPVYHQPMPTPMPIQIKPLPANVLEAWPNILNQTTTDKNKANELPSIFQDEEYEDYYKEIGCEEIDNGSDIDLYSYKDIY